ncbi:hypothetical protein [uncultured Sanguibacteroides sp.]|uniref:hypothetical protein n=1 Tax=uncultured Sanguibacteroides sp. TaxID=1635151 RepID=UPI0025F5DED3|nr:hypothetical protein [uncultured Sanguibacteroides sp.]
MKAWKDYTKQEKRMIIVLGVLLLAVLLSFGRVNREFRKGVKFFYPSLEKVSTPDSVGEKKAGGSL